MSRHAANESPPSEPDGLVAPGAQPGAPSVGQVSCSMASVLLTQVRTTRGEEAVARLLQTAGVPYTAAHLADPANWIWYDEAIALFEAAIELMGDEELPRRVGEETVRQHAGTPVATLLRSLGSPEAIYEQLAVGVTKFSTVTELQPVEVEPGRAVVRATARRGFRRHRYLCEWTQGLLSQPTALFGLPAARVEETSCEVRGDPHCEYRIGWDVEAAASMSDPQALISALEAQIVAMKDRLDSMYATARDLIAFDDLDAALARVTERAATAVRAPKYLLAVRLDHTGEVYVHHRGFDDEDPDRVASALLAGEVAHDDDSRLIAEVASTRRRYGWLMAATPTDAGSSAGAFFAQERDQLDVYARYAAAVLDLATALEDASWRADHDPLTELYNRRRLTTELERQLHHAARYRRSGALIMLDLDKFKIVNDSYGHAAGDRLLKSVAEVLSRRVRETDVVGRLGGDEFAVILPEADLAQALTLAESLRVLVKEIQSELPVELGVSMGVVVFHAAHRLSVDEAMVAADVALYRAKELGGDAVEVYSGQARAALSRAGRLQDALREDRLVLHAQPLVDLQSGHVARRELLLRMVGADGEISAPGTFLPIAEQFGLSAKLDRWVVGRALVLARAGEAVSVNLADSSIGDREILESLRAAIGDGLDPAKVVFELGEAAAERNLHGARAFIAALGELGCEVALDDFGAGFGSLASLQELGARYVKIDLGLVGALARDEVAARVVHAIVDVGHALGKLMVAEGVEDEATLEAVRRCGVDYAQGFHLGRPLPLQAPGAASASDAAA